MYSEAIGSIAIQLIQLQSIYLIVKKRQLGIRIVKNVFLPAPLFCSSQSK